MIDPLVILAVGIITVLGLILVLRVNAFLALITAAIVVSLMAPGGYGQKISRVAEEFGTSAGKIAIVIALAAIIGECMMRSGAADRIVQAFLNCLGIKRTSWALMGSGFVLAVPVFFDTVFYLLVPLARSLYRKTRKNYLLSILAIAAGGAITHTLVPPTPGPLLMAANLNIDVGLMILVGAIVALPAAIAGLAISRFLDAKLDVPYREVAVSEEDQPEEHVALPPLWLSLVPVLLPVVMISGNTAISTMADNEGVAHIQVSDIRDWDALQTRLRQAGPEEATPAGRLVKLLPPDVVRALQADTPPSDSVKNETVESLNRLLSSADVGQTLAMEGRAVPGIDKQLLYDDAAFEPVIEPSWKLLRRQSRQGPDDNDELLSRQLILNGLLRKDRSQFRRHDREHFNRLALEVAFPDVFDPHDYNTSLRQWADISSLFGNANFSLLLSTLVALFLLWKQKRPSLAKMSGIVEQALMSAGVIILITAGGGAFGEMLKVANVGTRIEGLFESGSAAGGLAYIFLGFGIAAVLKVAQGSSTVAMITGSAMVAAMITSPDSLGFNPVYLATAIGAGSLMGSWMNDSGFWIFARMGGLTEPEALKSWTVMLAVMSLTSLAMSVVLATLVPDLFGA